MSNPKDLPLDWFQEQQLKKLSSAKNVPKDHWLDMSCNELFERLKDEVEELGVELLDCTPCERGEPQNIISECVDVANFAAMLAHKMKLEIENK